MSLPRYAEYKDSGIPWVGEVPADWQVLPLIGVATERSEPNVGMRENNLLSLSYGRIVRKDIDSNDGLLPDSFETYQVIRAGDIVLRLTDLQNDKRSLRSALVGEQGIITSAYLALQPNRIDSRFLAYLMRGYDLSKVFYSMGGGLRQSMKFSDMKRMPLALPSKVEQTAIAAFLDREVGKIDAVIAEQEKLIALLAEKRRATISHTVTRGLNPDVSMKDSSVVWLGDIPEHWKITRLKYATSLIVDCPHETPVYDPDGNYKVIRTADITEGRMHSAKMYSVSQAEYLGRVRRQVLRRGDIVYGREGERWGYAAEVPDDDLYCLGQRMMQFRSAHGMNAQYLMFQLNSQSTYRQGQMDAVGATAPRVNVSTIRNYVLTHVLEQGTIANSLRAETAKLDAFDAEAAGAIILLNERRSALITAAVTGQIDVRGLVPLPAANTEEA
jgi:type I restriction enzyme S subunit